MRLVIRILGYEVFSVGPEDSPVSVLAHEGGYLIETDDEQDEGIPFGFAG